MSIYSRLCTFMKHSFLMKENRGPSFFVDVNCELWPLLWICDESYCFPLTSFSLPTLVMWILWKMYAFVNSQSHSSLSHLFIPYLYVSFLLQFIYLFVCGEELRKYKINRNSVNNKVNFINMLIDLKIPSNHPFST